MKLSEMRDWLERRDIQLTKSLGQNFLHDAHQLERIVSAAKLTLQDQVLEIGPGLGPLTSLLLERAGRVLAIEKDFRLVEVLRERFAAALASAASGDDLAAGHASEGKLELLHADAIDFLKDQPGDWRDWKLVANLPYSVASPILVELAAGIRAPKLLVVTLQLEVARRLMAQTDDDDYGILTLLVQLDFRPRDWFKIPPGCFFPSPDVDSACVILERRDQPLLPENLRPIFQKIIKRAFSQRRKMMMKLLKQDWPAERLIAVFAELNVSPLERAEKLSLEQFVGLTVKLGA